MKKGLLLVAVFALLCAVATTVRAETAHCTECGMMVDVASKYSSRMHDGKGEKWFCDIGDLIAFAKKHPLKDQKAEVKDQASGAWIDAGKAWYVRAEKRFSTPMGWGIAAYKDKADASKAGTPMDFETAVKIIK